MSPARAAVRAAPRAGAATALEPMYASIGREIPRGGGWTFEPKYDGIRVLAFARPRGVALMTRNGKDKARQFPEVVAALEALAARHGRAPLVLDGEIVALSDGAPARFQRLQTRMHVKDDAMIARYAAEMPAALIAFDLLLDGGDALLGEPWSARRARLERALRRRTSTHLRLGETVPGDGETMLRHARAAGWEGIIAKRMDAPYRPGRRADDWLKLKVEFRQEFVVGGYTEPRNTREHIGALLLGYFEDGRFVYAGHAGGGFTRRGLKEMYERLRPLARATPPFERPPRTNEPAHWVTPRAVVEVKFSEWTADGKLRQPIFLGVRDDKDPREVGREAESVQRDAAVRRPSPGPARAAASARKRPTPRAKGGARAGAKKTPTTTARGGRARGGRRGGPEGIVEQLEQLERDGGDGTLVFARGARLDVTSLDKVYFPAAGFTKGDVMRYYARAAPAILPAIADRPLSLKRFPQGIAGHSFFQQNATGVPPEAVRTTAVLAEDGVPVPRYVGGDLATLLYTVQLGTIAVHPWHSRVRSLDHPDYMVLDLDPDTGVPFARVVEVARWVKEELDALELHGAAKTSGSTGIHIFVPLPPRTTYDTSALLAELIAARVAGAHPEAATVERSLKARPKGTVYVDHGQNAWGKTAASVFAVRARAGATVSAPIPWRDLTPALDPGDFTIETVPGRLQRLARTWAEGMRRNSLRKALGALRKT